MRTNLIVAVLATGLLAACQTTEDAGDGFVRLSSAADLAPLYDRRLAFEGDDYVVIRGNGTLDGEFGGVVTRGTWEERDGYFCRVLSSGPERAVAAGEDCQLMELRGNVLRITRARGAGPQFEYTIT